ncbi:MAG: hypothetical protein PWP60_1021 [Candidatus Atribacteria bacterium]|uniref:LptA/OstA family protein n=1 Tax=Thermatribacter velox TaxID=3039681 RepID=A0ABZ2YDF2_9BACT|nr:hypothetical protein [Candidatus Atribacteria bacterium]
MFKLRYKLTAFWIIWVLCLAFLGATAFAQEETGQKREVLLERADKIQYDSQKETFLAQGNVVAVEGQNRITCQELVFNLQENTGIFSGQVVVTREKTVIQASRMEGDFDEEIYLFSGEVLLKKERSNEETTYIIWKASQLSFNGETEEAWSENGAEITWKEISLKADKVFYYPEDEATQQEERIVLEGNVLITEKEREIQVEKATYYLDSEVLDAEGVIKATFVIE